jgi:hypothetical protein
MSPLWAEDTRAGRGITGDGRITINVPAAAQRAPHRLWVEGAVGRPLTVETPFRRCVAYLDPAEYRSTWLANKAIYRTRLAMADGGELIVIALGVSRFGGPCRRRADPAGTAITREAHYRRWRPTPGSRRTSLRLRT